MLEVTPKLRLGGRQDGRDGVSELRIEKGDVCFKELASVGDGDPGTVVVVLYAAEPAGRLEILDDGAGAVISRGR